MEGQAHHIAKGDRQAALVQESAEGGRGVSKPVWNEGLQCTVYRLEYSFHSGEGWLHMRALDCCDMTGCIALFQRIDADVNTIFTMAGKMPDTAYVKLDDGWIAMKPSKDGYTVVDRV
jgi:hypothetical protein